MTRTRSYRLDNNTLVRDDGYSIIAYVDRNGNGLVSESIGIKRPHVGPIPDTLELITSRSGEFFYLKSFVVPGPGGAWLSFAKYPSLDDRPEQAKSAGYLEIKETTTGENYYRTLLEFHAYDLKAEHEPRSRPKDDQAVKDYLAMFMAAQEKQAARFNDVIKASGWTIDRIMSYVGEWVPFEADPVIDLREPPVSA